MAVTETTDSLLFMQVAQNDRIILKYHTDAGGDLCIKFIPIYLELSEDPEYKEILFLTIDAENNPVAKEKILNKKQPVMTIYFKGRLLDSNHASTKEGLITLLKKLLDQK